MRIGSSSSIKAAWSKTGRHDELLAAGGTCAALIAARVVEPVDEGPQKGCSSRCHERLSAMPKLLTASLPGLDEPTAVGAPENAAADAFAIAQAPTADVPAVDAMTNAIVVAGGGALILRDETILVGTAENDPEDPDDPPSGAPIVTARDETPVLRHRGLFARRLRARRASRNMGSPTAPVVGES